MLAPRKAREVRDVEGKRRPEPDHCRDPGEEEPERERPLAAERGGAAEHGAESSSPCRSPREERHSSQYQERSRQRLEPLDGLGSVPDKVQVHGPEDQEGQVVWELESHQFPPAAKLRPAGPEDREDLVNGEAAYPCLDSEPPASHQRSKQGRHVRPAKTERGTQQDRERNPVPRSSVSVEEHRNQRDGIPDEDRCQGHRPGEPGLDQGSGQHVGRNADAHADPERGKVPTVPRALAQWRGNESTACITRCRYPRRLHQVLRQPGNPHAGAPARSAARASARRVSTPARLRR